ncbi:S8 family peptidase [Streptomyces sp. NPDC057011]|uniref:S8 family peptidase n=1 Tax=unclassified Streptomyces TaxID=2593676 RepID=UPI00362A408A
MHLMRIRLSAVLSAALLVAGLQFAATTAAQGAPPPGDLRLAPAATAVPDSWIVVLKDGTDVSGAHAMASGAGGEVGHVYRSALRGFSVRASQDRAAELAADPRVAYVEQDAEVRASDTQSNAPWGLDRIDQRALPLSQTYTYDSTASTVTAYVIDTGIRTTHADFGNRARVGFDAFGGNGQDCNGHGTHVAGTVGGTTYGVAKGASLVSVRVLNCSGSGTTAGVIAGVDWVSANAAKPAVANMSLGGGISSALDGAVARSISSGVTYAIAAGNSAANACNYSPGRTPSAITVGATLRWDARASFSNYGSCLDLFAPGVGITSDWNTGDTATNSLSGTSMAAPHVAGTAALYLAAHPAASPVQVRDAVVANATAGAVVVPGPGSPNRLLYSRF